MFKITKNPEFTHDVPVLVPCDGGHVEQSLRVRFRAISVDEMNTHSMYGDGQETYLRAVCVRFEDVADDDGQPIPPSEELTTKLLAIPFVRVALIRAYTLAMSKAKTGN
jgi:hypothetical protein